MEESKIRYFDTHTPALTELCQVLNDGLKSYFEEVHVELVDCPDFTQKPSKIPVLGLTGKATIADVGGGEYYVIRENLNRINKCLLRNICLTLSSI
jgi:hypothetical protein